MSGWVAASILLSAGTYLFDFCSNLAVIYEYGRPYLRFLRLKQQNRCFGLCQSLASEVSAYFWCLLGFFIMAHTLNALMFKLKFREEDGPYRLAYFLPLIHLWRLLSLVRRTMSCKGVEDLRCPAMSGLYSILGCSLEGMPILTLQFAAESAAAMADESPRRRYSYSPSPRGGGRSRSRSPAPYKRETRDEYESRDDRREPRDAPVKEEEISNPGNNLYVTGLSTRVTEQDLQDYFAREGKVVDCRLVVDPRSRESRGFGFVTMETLEDAERCVKRLNHSNLEGRIITVEKAKRKRARTPTPGRYLGNRSATVRSFGGGRRDHRDDYYRGGGGGGGGGGHHGSSYRRSPRYSPYRGGRDDYDRSPDYRHRRDRSPDYSPHGRSHRRDYDRSPDYGRRERDRSPVPYYRH